MKTAFRIAIVVITLASGVWAWREFDRARRTRAQVEELAGRQHRVEAQIARARSPVLTPSRDEAGITAAAAAVARPAVAKTGPSPAVHEILQAHPELRAEFRRDYRFKLRDDYERFYRTAHLTGDQIDRFEQLMLAAEEERMDVEATLRAQAPGRAAARKIWEQFEAKLAAAQKEMLGEAGYAELAQFDQPPAKLLNSVEDRLAEVGSPLTDDQRASLRNILMTTFRSEEALRRSNKKPGTETPLPWMDIAWPQAWAKAQAILSPSQLAIFKAETAWGEFQFLVGDFGRREVASGKR